MLENDINLIIFKRRVSLSAENCMLFEGEWEAFVIMCNVS